MVSTMYVISSLCILSLLGFVLSSKYILMSLIYLESAMLGCMLFLIASSVGTGSMGLWLITLLTMSACEAAVGLTLMVNFVRVNHCGVFSSWYVHN